MTEVYQRGFKGIWIPSDLWFDKNLKNKNELVLYVEIDSLSTDKQPCYASNKYLADFMDLSPGRVSQLISSLEKKGYIRTEKIYSKINPKQVQKRNIYPIRKLSRGVVSELNTPSKFSKGGYLENIQESVLGSLTKKHSNKDIVEQARPQLPYNQIIDYLNQKAKKHFKYAETSKKRIRTRWNEGYRLKDFEKVIDIKCSDWINDPKMNEYLRPSTLFGDKFEAYLNSKPKKKSFNKPYVERATDWSKKQAKSMTDADKEALEEKKLNMLADLRQIDKRLPNETIEEFQKRVSAAGKKNFK